MAWSRPLALALCIAAAGAAAAEPPRDFQRPRERMLIFWGCGEHAPPDQPVEIDLAQAAPGGAPLADQVLARDPAPNATVYVAGVMGDGGGADGETVVFWTSSDRPALAAPDDLAPAEGVRRVASRALAGPQAVRCAMPREVVDAAPHEVLQLVAYGPEASFAQPSRPRDRQFAWNRQWEVKVRYRSASARRPRAPVPGL